MRFQTMQNRARAPWRASIQILLSALALCIGASVIATPAAAQKRPGIVRVLIETERGNITVDLDSARAPNTVTNFLRYVDGGLYNEGRFHRTVTADNQPRDTVRIAVIQGGVAPANSRSGFPPIALERTNETGIKHTDGTISMARAGANTATSDFFLCVGDQPALDFAGHRNLDGQGFAAFGVVTAGMDVVRAIHQSSAEGQSLKPPVTIRRVARAP